MSRASKKKGAADIKASGSFSEVIVGKEESLYNQKQARN
jgi:hypothetical protein